MQKITDKFIRFEGPIITVPFRRSSVHIICAGAFAAVAMDGAHALSLGSLRVQSALGQQLKAQVDITGPDAQDIEQNCFKASIESADGVLLSPANLSLSTLAGNRVLSLSSRKTIPEPAIKVVLSIACEVQVKREYFILLDPPDISVLSAGKGVELPVVSLPERNADTGKPAVVRSQLVKKPAKRNNEESLAVSEPSIKKKTGTPSAIKTKPKDALRLSDEIDILPQGLKISDTLSMSADTAGVRPDIADLRLAQAHFAAMMRGEGDVPVSADKVTADEQKMQSLQKEAVQLKQQLQQDKVTIDDLKDSSVPKGWLYALAAIILGGSAIMVLLLAYLRRIHKSQSLTWWEQSKGQGDIPEPKRKIEDIVDSVQATYAPLNTDSKPLNTFDQPSSILRQPHTMPPAARQDEKRDLGKLDAVSVFGRSYTPSLEDTNSSTFNFFSSRNNSVKVEEISDVTQEAEFWMSVNDPERAIEILEPLAETEQPDSPVPWLYLLDLYRVIGAKEKYDNLRDRFAVFFNANIPEFEVDPASLPARHLDDFEHLSKKVCALWNSNDILPFLESLLVDDRDGKRMGFELPVYRDILLLISIANELERLKAFGEAAGSRQAASSIQKSAVVSELKEDAVKPESNLIDFEPIEFVKK